MLSVPLVSFLAPTAVFGIAVMLSPEVVHWPPASNACVKSAPSPATPAARHLPAFADSVHLVLSGTMHLPKDLRRELLDAPGTYYEAENLRVSDLADEVFLGAFASAAGGRLTLVAGGDGDALACLAPPGRIITRDHQGGEEELELPSEPVSAPCAKELSRLRARLGVVFPLGRCRARISWRPCDSSSPPVCPSSVAKFLCDRDPALRLREAAPAEERTRRLRGVRVPT